jgi:AcrR family transcriptional regulator
MEDDRLEPEPIPSPVVTPRGRPRSAAAQRAILDAFQELLIEVGFAHLRLEHVAARAGTSKATIYRRWRSKEELAVELLRDLATPQIGVADMGGARQELVAIARHVVQRLTETEFGPVVRRLLCEIAGNPTVADPFRAAVVEARRDEVGRVIERGIARGDLRPSTDPELATELLIGPIYFRMLFGGTLSLGYGTKVVDALLAGCATDRDLTKVLPQPEIAQGGPG